MTKEEILNGMSEEEFYQMYPTKEAWEEAQQMKLGGLSGAPHNGQPTANQFFSYGSHALDAINIPFGHFAYGGGLPGGPNEYGMPCYTCGGQHMEEGGLVTYQTAGSTNSLLDKYRIASQKELFNTITNPKKNKELNNLYPNYTVNPDSSNSKFIVKPGDLHPIPLTDFEKKEALNNLYPYYNIDPTLIEPNTLNEQEFGGAYDPSNAGTYPVLDMGGLKKIINAAAKKTKKEFGGDLTQQGGNQDYLSQYKNNFKNYIAQNVYNDTVDKEQEAMINELNQMDQMPMARTGYQYNSQREGLMQQLADTYAPTKRSYNWNLGNYPMNMLKSYFPMNEFYGYEFGKKDYEKLHDMKGQGKITGMELKYGPLGRVMPRLFGPKSVTYGVVDPSHGYYEDNLMYADTLGAYNKGKKDKDNYKGPYPDAVDTDYTEYKSPLEAGIKQTRVEQMMNPFADEYKKQIDILRGPYTGEPPSFGEHVSEDYDFMKDVQSNAAEIKQDNWNYSKNSPMKSTSSQSPLKFNESMEEAMNNSKLGDNYKIVKTRAYGGLIEAEDGIENPIGLEPDYLTPKDPTSLFSQYADQELKKSMSEAEHLKNPITNSMYNVKPYTAERQIYWGDAAKYAPAAFNYAASLFEGPHDRREREDRQQQLFTPGSDVGPFALESARTPDKGDYTVNQGFFRPTNTGFKTSFRQFGGYVEGDEVDLTPEEIAELRAQGYQIEELD